MLGDMILCYTRACEQAEQFGHSPARECGYLTNAFRAALLGYDHERNDEDTRLMRSKEEGQPCVPRPDAGLSHEKEYPKTERELPARFRGLRLCIHDERNFACT